MTLYVDVPATPRWKNFEGVLIASFGLRPNSCVSLTPRAHVCVHSTVHRHVRHADEAHTSDNVLKAPQRPHSARR